MKLYHGTSLDNAYNIIQNGFNDLTWFSNNKILALGFATQKHAKPVLVSFEIESSLVDMYAEKTKHYDHPNPKYNGMYYQIEKDQNRTYNLSLEIPTLKERMTAELFEWLGAEVVC